MGLIESYKQSMRRTYIKGMDVDYIIKASYAISIIIPLIATGIIYLLRDLLKQGILFCEIYFVLTLAGSLWIAKFHADLLNGDRDMIEKLNSSP